MSTAVTSVPDSSFPVEDASSIGTELQASIPVAAISKNRSSLIAGSHPAAVLLGVGITVGLTVFPKLLLGIFRPKNRKAVAPPQSPETTPHKLVKEVSIMKSVAFGSPVNAATTPTLSQKSKLLMVRMPGLCVMQIGDRT